MSPTKQASKWLADFSHALSDGDPATITALFGAECFWRDLLAFTWNVITLEGTGQIAAMLRECLPSVGPVVLSLDGEAAREGDVTAALFKIETAVARGRGFLRLKDGKCWTLLTAIDELNGHEERRGANRIQGVEHRARKDRTTWLEERSREQRELGSSKQPYCLIIGGGQGGIMLGGALAQTGRPCNHC